MTANPKPATKPKRGRPALDPANRRKLHRFRATDAEWAAWESLAGRNKVSAWLRQLANRAVAKAARVRDRAARPRKPKP